MDLLALTQSTDCIARTGHQTNFEILYSHLATRLPLLNHKIDYFISFAQISLGVKSEF